MTRLRPILCGILLTGLAACAEGPDGQTVTATAPPDQPVPGSVAPAPQLSLPVPTPGPDANPPRRTLDTRAVQTAPQIYMDLQQGSAGTVSVVFAIDTSADGTPSDEAALRLTPEDGDCNPQEMARYTFPQGAEPVFGPSQAARLASPGDLPAYLAVVVTRTMIERGLAQEPEDTRPQHVCTRKLFERQAMAEASTGSAGQ